MSRDRYLIGSILRSPDEGGGGGTATVDDELDTTGEDSEAIEGSDLEDGGASDDGNAGDDAGSDGADGKAAPKPLSDEEFQAELAKRGLAVAPVAKADDEPKPELAPDPLKSTPNFRIDARRAVMNHADALKNGWIDEEGAMTPTGIDRAEDYALALAADWRAGQDKTAREAEAKTHLERTKPAHIASHVEMFKAEGEPEEVAARLGRDMVDAMIEYGPAAFTDSDEAQRLRTGAWVYAHGLERIREMTAKKDGGDAKPAKKAPIDGPPAENGVSKESAQFEKEYAERHDGSNLAGSAVTKGKPLTAKQREHLKAEFPAMYE